MIAAFCQATHVRASVHNSAMLQEPLTSLGGQQLTNVPAACATAKPRVQVRPYELKPFALQRTWHY